MKALELVLDPLVPQRAPAHADGPLTYGYRLRLPGGPLLAADDPLLAAYGAAVVAVDADDEHTEALQDARFDPGSALRLRHEPYDGEDSECVRVSDADGLREVGELPTDAARLALAGLEHGLGTVALVLREERILRDHRRTDVEVLVYSPSLVRVAPPEKRFIRPEREARRRVVLVADGGPEVHWWDADAESGPAVTADLPVSPKLAHDLGNLAEAYEALMSEDTDPAVDQWEREALGDRARVLWLRARTELGRRYVVGYLGPGMRHPAWFPSELRGDEADEFVDLPFFD